MDDPFLQEFIMYLGREDTNTHTNKLYFLSFYLLLNFHDFYFFKKFYSLSLNRL